MIPSAVVVALVVAVVVVLLGAGDISTAVLVVLAGDISTAVVVVEDVFRLFAAGGFGGVEDALAPVIIILMHPRAPRLSCTRMSFMEVLLHSRSKAMFAIGLWP